MTSMTGGGMLDCLIIGDANRDHMVKVVSIRFINVKVPSLPFN